MSNDGFHVLIFSMFFGINVLIQHNMFITFSNLFVHANVNKQFFKSFFSNISIFLHIFSSFCTHFDVFFEHSWYLSTIFASFFIFYIFKFCTLFVKCQQCKNLLKPFLFTTRYGRSDGRHLSSFIVFTLNGISFGSEQLHCKQNIAE
jgi:hypothetical protein